MSALLIYNARLVDKFTDEKGALLCKDGKIAAVFMGDFSDANRASSVALNFLCPSDKYLGRNEIVAVHGESSSSDGADSVPVSSLDIFDAKGLIVTPAFIDMHVHLRDPGLTHKEDLQSGLKACAHGGYGTVVAMPNTSPVVSDGKDALSIMERGNALGFAKMFQTVSITKAFEGKDISHLDNLDREEIPVITEDGHDVLSSALMLEGMKKAGKNAQIVSCHCEDCTLAEAARPHRAKALEIMKEHKLSAWGGGDVACVPEEALTQIDSELTEANSILELAEDTATERNIRLAKKADCHIHICHISTEGSVEAVRRAKKMTAQTCGISEEENMEKNDGFAVTAEATAHHIALCGDKEPLIRALVNPPLRTEKDRNSVIEGLRDGTIDCIANDHAPHTAEDKSKGAPGFTGIEAAYGVCHTELVLKNNFSEKKLSALMSANPAKILHLKKGLLQAGYDADFALCNPKEEWTVKPEEFYSKGKATPFEGAVLTGRVKGIILGGKTVKF